MGKRSSEQPPPEYADYQDALSADDDNIGNTNTTNHTATFYDARSYDGTRSYDGSYDDDTLGDLPPMMSRMAGRHITFPSSAPDSIEEGLGDSDNILMQLPLEGGHVHQPHRLSIHDNFNVNNMSLNEIDLEASMAHGLGANDPNAEKKKLPQPNFLQRQMRRFSMQNKENDLPAVVEVSENKDDNFHLSQDTIDLAYQTRQRQKYFLCTSFAFLVVLFIAAAADTAINAQNRGEGGGESTLFSSSLLSSSLLGGGGGANSIVNTTTSTIINTPSKTTKANAAAITIQDVIMTCVVEKNIDNLLPQNVQEKMFSLTMKLSLEPSFECQPTHVALVFLALNQKQNLSIDRLRARYALAVLYLSLGGPQWTRQRGWLTNSNECDWSGVDCSFKGEVTELLLANNNIHGGTGLPTHLGLLTHLRNLELAQNQIQGSLPSQICTQLTSLEQLLLGDNRFDGTLPPDLFSSKSANKLRVLELDGNQFVGSVPTQIGLLHDTLREY